jgi:hypothetical protein
MAFRRDSSSLNKKYIMKNEWQQTPPPSQSLNDFSLLILELKGNILQDDIQHFKRANFSILGPPKERIKREICKKKERERKRKKCVGLIAQHRED